MTGKKIKLCLTDTDSLFYEIKIDGVYKKLFQDKELFDNSNYPENSEFFFDENDKVIGKMKDEAAGIPIKELIGLRSKMYSYSADHKSLSKIKKKISKNTIQDIKKCKTLKKSTINKITTSKFGSVLDDNIFKEINRCKKLKERTKDQVKKCFIYESKKCKGISKHTVKKGITIDDYRDTLFISIEKMHSMKTIRSHNRNIKSSEIT